MFRIFFTAFFLLNLGHVVIQDDPAKQVPQRVKVKSLSAESGGLREIEFDFASAEVTCTSFGGTERKAKMEKSQIVDFWQVCSEAREGTEYRSHSVLYAIEVERASRNYRFVTNSHRLYKEQYLLYRRLFRHRFGPSLSPRKPPAAALRAGPNRNRHRPQAIDL